MYLSRYLSLSVSGKQEIFLRQRLFKDENNTNKERK